jgi:hypothetical protein
MADDPLTRFSSMFRRAQPVSEAKLAPASPAAPPPPEQGRQAYEAFDAKDRAYAHGFDIRCTSRQGALSYIVMYNYIHTLAYDRRSWTRIFITVSGLAIEIRGRNLRPIVDALRTRTCDFIQEYSEDEHICRSPRTRTRRSLRVFPLR